MQSRVSTRLSSVSVPLRYSGIQFGADWALAHAAHYAGSTGVPSYDELLGIRNSVPTKDLKRFSGIICSVECMRPTDRTALFGGCHGADFWDAISGLAF